MRKYLISTIAIIFVLSLGVGMAVKSYSGSAKIVVEGDYIEAMSNVAEDALGALVSPFIYTKLYLNGGMDVDSGNLDVDTQLITGKADQTASTTALDDTTLLESELLLGAFTITNTGDGGADGLFTLTLPATSTITTMLPNDGECNPHPFRIYNAHATAASSTTITAGTGMTIYESENGDEVIAGLGVGLLTFCRKADTDIDVFISGYTTD